MDINLNWIQSLMLVGSLIGFVVSLIILFTQRRNRLCGRVLALFLIITTLPFLLDPIIPRDIISVFSLLDSFIFLFGPLILLFVTTFLSGQSHFSIKEYGHFVPFLLHALYLTYVISEFYTVEMHFFTHQIVGVNWSQVIEVLGSCHIILYLGLSVDKLRKFRFWIEDHYSTTDQEGFTWVNRIVTSLFLMCCGYVLLFGADIPYLQISVPYFIHVSFDLGFTILIAWIALYSLITPSVFVARLTYFIEPQHSHLTSEEHSINVTLNGLNSELDTEFSNNDIDDERQADLIQKIILFMETEKPFLDPTLSLKKLASQLRLPQRELSQVLNQSLNQTFYNFVNGYRIEEVKSKLAEQESESQKLEGIAYDSGFRSSSTFNRLFKKHTNMTPQQFRATQIIKLQQ